MKLPLSWLKEYVDIGDITPAELSDKLLSIGFEVEEIIAPPKITGVVVGKVLSIVHHDNSDKLWICQIDIGKTTVQIVTGAQNVRQGDIVPVATVGAELVGGKKITEAKLRGVDSYGMLCSGEELGVDDDVIDGASVNGILILPKDFKVGEDVMHAIGADDTVLDVSITANRPDCQAVCNLAREIAILVDKPFKMPKLTYNCTATAAEGEMPSVTIKDKELCSRYIGRLIKDVKIEKSPKWMRDRLRMCGIRPINNLVDITNYVLLEFGQPLHAFDRRYIKDSVIVRKGKNEKITALDGKEYDVNDCLIIADAQKPLAIAGIMGGEYTSIFPDTSDVFLEAARFERSNIRRTSRKIGLRSDSSARYEKGVDWQTTEYGSERALALVDMLNCGKVCDNVVTDSIAQPENKIIKTTKQEICNLLGIDIDKKIIVSLLKKQGFDVKVSGKTLTCTVPLVREDVDSYADLAEDVMRFYGYDNVVSTHSENTHQTRGYMSDHDINSDKIKTSLIAMGIDEILNYSFISPDAAPKLMLNSDELKEIPIKNPLSRDISVMRTQLVSPMLSSMSRNCARKNDTMRFFELGKVFIAKELPLKELPDERDVLCIGTCNDGDFYNLKSAVTEVLRLLGVTADYTPSSTPYLHPKQSLHVEGDGVVGDFGRLHPIVAENFEFNAKESVYIAHIDITEALARPIGLAKYKPISKFQPVVRDLAVLIKTDVPIGDMLKTVKSSNGYISDVKLFDIYEGKQIPENHRSVAFSVTLQPQERTFSEAEIGNIMNGIVEQISKKYGATLRS